MFSGKLEADDASLALVYGYFGELYHHFEHEKIEQDKVKKRLEFLYTKTMGLAYMLTPKNAANGFFFDDDYTDIMSYAREFVIKIVPGATEDFQHEIQEDMVAFVAKMSTLAPFRQELIFPMSAQSYWNTIGRREFKALYIIAKPISEMICSSASSERTWSTFRFIHSRLRNRLTNDRVNKLVFLYTNSVLLDENDKNDYILEDGAVLNGSDCEEILDNNPIS